MTDEQPQQQWLTAPELALVFKVGSDTIRRRAAAGDLPGVRVGRQWRFQLAEVEAHLRAARENRDPWARPAASRRALHRRRAS